MESLKKISGILLIFLLVSCENTTEIYTTKYSFYDKRRIMSQNVYHKNADCKGIADNVDLSRIDIENIQEYIDLCPICISSSLKNKIEKSIKQNKIREGILQQERLKWIKDKCIIVKYAFQNIRSREHKNELTYEATKKINKIDVNNYSFFIKQVSIDEVVIVSSEDLFAVANEEVIDFRKLFKEAEEVKIYFIREEDNKEQHWIVTKEELNYRSPHFNTSMIYKESGLEKTFIHSK